MAGSPFEISAKDVDRFNDVEFLDFLNKLFLAEIHKLGVPPMSLESSLRHTDPDGGVDSRTTIPEWPPERWVPRGLTAWQFKSGGIKPGDIKKEFKKTGVQSVVTAGGSYGIIVGKDYSDPLRQSRKKTLEACFKGKGKKNRSRLYTSTDIANWANEHPGLLLQPYLERPIGDFLRVESLQRQEHHRVQFVEDDLRVNAISALRETIQRCHPAHLRVEGKAGAGKTRLVMEALSLPGLAERVLWAIGPDVIPNGLFKWFETHQSSGGIIVVDECPRGDAEKMAQLVEPSSGRLVLITIDHSSQVSVPAGPAEGRIEVGLLDEKKLEAVIKNAAPALPPDVRERIANISGGYVKLATALALAYAKDPKMPSVTELTKDQRVQRHLEALLPNPEDREGMKAFAVLSRVGMEGDLSAEGKAVARFLDIPWTKLQSVAKRMVDRGLVARRGRYRYVTPHILGVWLALDVWETRGEEMFELLRALPTEGSKQALLERLLDLGDVQQARPLVQKLLGEEGLYRDLSDIDDRTRGKVFNILATALPEAGIAALERLIRPLPREALLEFTEGRRSVVWTLQSLAWTPATFFDAGRLLLLLADAENERFSNNAQGVWGGLFRIYLGGTAVPAVERHPLIREALESETISIRTLGVKAIESCFETHEVRTAGAERQGGRILAPEWRPKSREEDLAVRMSALSLLDLALSDPDQKVRGESLNTLLSATHALVRLNLFDEAIRRIERLTLTEDERWRTIKLLRHVLRYDKGWLTQNQLEKLNSVISVLEGPDSGSRLRSLIGPESDYNVTQESTEERQQLKDLIEEFLAKPEVLNEQLTWLTSPQAKFSGVFGFELGKIDLEKRWLLPFVERARYGDGVFLLSSYLQGIQARGETDSVQQLLDEWTASEQGLAPVVLETTWRSSPTKRGADRIISLVDKGWLDPNSLGTLGYGGWTAGLPSEEFRAIFERLLVSSQDETIEHAAFILLSRIEKHKDEVDPLSELAWKFLDRAVPLPRDRNVSVMYYLEEITRFYASEDPKRLVRAILKRVRDHDEVFLDSDPLMRMLEHATRATPERIWGIIGRELLTRDMTAYRLTLALNNWYVRLIPEATLLKWAADHRPHGPRVLASLSPVGSVPLDSLARKLLIQYDDADENIGSQLYANFRTGSWSGPYSNVLASKLKTVKEWSKDRNKTVREWARPIVKGLEGELRKVELEEEERAW
ncbi:MAG: hypothetical protein ACE5JU_21525 [Candidatus Binatia bacterium]